VLQTQLYAYFRFLLSLSAADSVKIKSYFNCCNWCVFSSVKAYEFRTLNGVQSTVRSPSSSSDSLHQNSPESDDEFVTRMSQAVTFSRPFEYSTSVWTDDGCNKNATKFRPWHQSPQRPDMTSSTSSPVNAVLQTPIFVADGGRTASTKPFIYQLTSPNNPPHMKFTINGK
jgi:hypothetical protein